MRSLLITLSTLAVLFGSPASGQLLSPADTIRIVVPFAAGGSVDQIGRSIALEMGKALNASVIVENMGGAGGMIGTNAAAKAPADGRTLLLGTSGTHVINPALRGTHQQVADGFEPIAFIGAVKNVVVVRKGLQAGTFEELVALAKSGQKMTFASAGPGTTLHVAGEMINAAAGIKVVHVPYRGLAPAMTDLVAGHVDFLVTSVIGVLPYVKDGSIRAIATFDAERAAQLPDVPSMAELGHPDLTLPNWYGLLVPRGVSEERRVQLEKAIMAILRSDDMRARLSASGVDGEQPAAGFKSLLDAEFSRWPALLKTLGIEAGAKK